MRLNILTESNNLRESPFDLNISFEIISSEHSLTPSLDPTISREFIKGLNIDKVCDVVSAYRPYVVDFFKGVLNRDYESILDVLYPIAAVLSGPFANNSSIIDEFKSVLSIGKTYYEVVNNFLSFYDTLDSDSSIVLEKIKAIYDRFKDNRAKLLDGLFTKYEEYLKTLENGKETTKSKTAKQQLYAEYVRNQTTIEDVLDEVSSISINKHEDSPLKSIKWKNYDIVSKYFEENRADIKKIAGKLLYLSYFDNLLKDSQGKFYKVSKYSKFTAKKDKNTIVSEIKSKLESSIKGDIEINLTYDGFKIIAKGISSTDIESTIEAVKQISSDGYFTLNFLDMYEEIKSLPIYSFYYAYDEVFGTKTLYASAARLLDVDSARNAATILASQPMPSNFDSSEYSIKIGGKYAISVGHNQIVSNKILLEDSDYGEKATKIMEILKDLDLSEFEETIKSLVKRLAKNPDATYTIDDVLRDMRRNKGSNFSVLSYSILKKALKDPALYDDIEDVLSYIAYHAAINGTEFNKLFKTLFKHVLLNNQDDVIDNMIKKSKGDEKILDDIKNFLLDYRKVLSPESLTRLGVPVDAE